MAQVENTVDQDSAGHRYPGRDDQAFQSLVADSAFELLPGGLVLVGADGAILKANETARQFLGFGYDELTHRYTTDWSPETIREDGSPCPPTEYPVSLALSTGRQHGPTIIGVKAPGGGLRWAEFRARPIFSSDGSSAGALVAFQDITKFKEQSQRLWQREEDLRVLVQNIPHYVLIYDAEGRIVFVNRVHASISVDQVLGRTLFDFYPEEEHAGVKERLERVLKNGISEEFKSSIVLSGTEMHFHNVWWRMERKGTYLVGAVATDITGLVELNENLRFQATHDSLTGLANRFQFEQVVNEALGSAREGMRHALCYLDLDQFKVVNDTCGHAAGDELLRQLAGEIKRVLPTGVLVARLGGDEFGLLLPDVHPEEAIQQAHALRASIDQFRFIRDGRLFRVGVSIGLVLIDERSESFSRLLKDADEACFVAKDSGRNKVHVFNAEDDRQNQHRDAMVRVNALSAALENDGFRLFYQKIVPVRIKNSGAGLEILLRLAGPDGQILVPGAFIHAAERYDMMTRIDRWVLRNTLGWLEKFSEAGRGLEFISINLSGRSLGDEAFHRFCFSLFEALSIPAEKIQFEITETAALADPGLTRQFMLDLIQRGVRFALDDFGTGLSSFSYLRNLPVHMIKIDGAFVRGIATDPVDHRLVQSMHDLAHFMNLKTVAEYVENSAILDRLEAIGFDYAQGFFLHLPEPLIVPR